MFTVEDGDRISEDNVTVTPYKGKMSVYSLSNQKSYIEKKFLRPMIKGADVKPFHAESNYVVPFAYEQTYSTRVAISETSLREQSPKLYRMFQASKGIFLKQNAYSKKLINGESVPFYSLARVGDYSFAPISVVFRDNTKNVAAVVKDVDLPWGDKSSPVFQNHAVTISQRPDGTFLGEDEAYYISAVINSDAVISFVSASSDSRSFPVRPRYQIPVWGETDSVFSIQKHLAQLAKQAHEHYEDDDYIKNITYNASYLYVEMLHRLEKIGPKVIGKISRRKKKLMLAPKKYKIMLDIQHQAMELVELDEPQPNNRLDETATTIIEGTDVSFVPSAANGPRREVFLGDVSYALPEDAILLSKIDDEGETTGFSIMEGRKLMESISFGERLV